MSQDDQEALAAQWAAQLEEEEAGQPGGCLLYTSDAADD